MKVCLIYSSVWSWWDFRCLDTSRLWFCLVFSHELFTNLTTGYHILSGRVCPTVPCRKKCSMKFDSSYHPMPRMFLRKYIEQSSTICQSFVSNTRRNVWPSTKTPKKNEGVVELEVFLCRIKYSFQVDGMTSQTNPRLNRKPGWKWLKICCNYDNASKPTFLCWFLLFFRVWDRFGFSMWNIFPSHAWVCFFKVSTRQSKSPKFIPKSIAIRDVQRIFMFWNFFGFSFFVVFFF